MYETFELFSLFCLSVFICNPRPAATLGVQTWPRKRQGATHTLDALWTWRSRAHPPDTPPSRFPSTKIPVQRSSKHTPTVPHLKYEDILRGVGCGITNTPLPAYQLPG